MASSDPMAEPEVFLVPVRYPESDGKPLGESTAHVRAILHLYQALLWIYREVADVFIASNLFLYYEEGVPSACTCPDVQVTKGIPGGNRRVYKLWTEGAAPGLVVEVTSRSSRIEDLGTKRALYEMLGVEEYLVFDPLDEYLKPRFQAFTLQGGSYRPVELGEDARFESRQLGVAFQPEGDILRVFDLATGKPVPCLEEETHRAEEESRRAEEESRRAKRLEEELRLYRERFGKLEEG